MIVIANLIIDPKIQEQGSSFQVNQHETSNIYYPNRYSERGLMWPEIEQTSFFSWGAL